MTDRACGVSVIVPTRNRVTFLKRALNSILAQRLPADEILVVDDASTDATGAAVAAYRPAPIRYLKLPERRGAAQARNLGIAAATGRYLAFLDDDDLWLPDKLALQVARLDQSGERVGLVCSAYRVVSELTGAEYKTWTPPDRPMDAAYFLRTTGFMTTVPLVRRGCFETAGGFDEALTGSQDQDMWIRIAEAYEVTAIPQVLAEHRIHGTQITTDLVAKAAASARMLNKYRERLGEHPTLLRRHLERAALLHCAAHLPEAGRAYLLEVIALDPDRPELREHLRRSNQDPLAHAADVFEHAFRTVDGIRLFY